MSELTPTRSAGVADGTTAARETQLQQLTPERGSFGGSSRSALKPLPSVRMLIGLMVVVPMAVVSAALIWVATVTSRNISEQLGQEIVNTTTDRVVADVRQYLGSAVRVSDLYAARIKDGVLQTGKLEMWERMMFHDLDTNPDIASICFTTIDGDCTWLLHAHGRLELGLVHGNARDKAIEFAMDAAGNVDRSKTLREYAYDATQRPWYDIARKTSGPTWTPIYFWFPEQKDTTVTGTGYTRLIFDADHRPIGVLIIDVTLAALSEHLKHLPSIARAGSAFIVDEQGLLVAASDGPISSPNGQRLSPAASTSPAAQAIADLVSADVHGEQITAPEVESARIFVSNEPARAQVTEIKPYPGIHWHIVTVLPEAAFFTSAKALQQRAILLATGTIIAAVAVGLLMGRRLAEPLMQLTKHVARVGAGDFDTKLSLSSASELQRLSDEVNRMANGLKHRMMLERSIGVATQVQQSLLPSIIPKIQGLEIAACSKYCESTGGDYYDFIDMPHMEGHRMLITVGDVTGHGIGAAMLMSMARGAIRASCDQAPSLAHVMTRANSVLAGSAHQGMFMTLSLLLINPQTGYAHWANAGHDPVMVYHPNTDCFEELLSGDMPLGIEPETIYREFSRHCATPGSIMLIGTDGIWEARNHERQMFGKERLRHLIRNHHASADELSEAIKHAMYTWMGDAPLQDDVTFVIIRVCPKAP